MRIEAMLWIVVFILVALAFLFPKTRAFSLSATAVAIVAVVVIVVFAKRGEPVALVTAAPPAVEKKPVDFERFHIEKLASRRFDSIKYTPSLGQNATASARLWRDCTTTPRLTH
jgi:hypothetical protein